MRFLYSLTIFVGAALLFLVQPMVGKMILPLAGGTPAVWTTCMVFFQAALLAGYFYAHAGTVKFGPRGMAGLHPALLVLPLLVLVGTAVFSQQSPLVPIKALAPHDTRYPFFPLAMLMTALVGLPFFFVATSAPLLQRWFADTGDPAAADPYFLYAASNLGSFVGLILYPVVLERYLPISQQAWVWSAGFALWVALTAMCARTLKATAGRTTVAAVLPWTPVSWFDRVRWMGLAAVPSSLMLSVITVATTDVAPIPLFFIVPLGIYLLTFVIAFGIRANWVFTISKLLLPMLLLVAIFLRLTELETKFPDMIQALVEMVTEWFGNKVTIPSMVCQIFYYIGMFTIIAQACHLALAQSRPGAGRLTEFFLWVSFGGVLGGLFNAVVAPVVFIEHTEYIVGLIAACFCVAPRKTEEQEGPWPIVLDVALPVAVFGLAYVLLAGFGSGESKALDGESIVWKNLRSTFTTWHEQLAGQQNNTAWYDRLKTIACFGVPALITFLFVERPLRFGLAVTGIFVATVIVSDEIETHKVAEGANKTHFAGRSFFGTLSVADWWDGDVLYHKLIHGTTLHGQQAFMPPSGDPLTYYHKNGPVGDIFTTTPVGMSKRPIAFVGLGSGSISAYVQPGQQATFYEIDSLVVRLATNPKYFTYVTDAKERGGKIDFVMGDARLRLEEAAPGAYALLAVDAFSSDSIPVHLLTREAIVMYMSKLAPDGILALHVSNRYLHLDRVVARIVEELDLPAYQWYDNDETSPGKSRSDWIVVARNKSAFGNLLKIPDMDGDKRWKPFYINREPAAPADSEAEKAQKEKLRELEKEFSVVKPAPLWTDDFYNVLEVFNW